MLVLISSIFSGSTLISYVVAAIISITMAFLLRSLINPFKRKEYGLRCDELKISSSELNLLTKDIECDNNLPQKEFQRLIKQNSEKFVFVEVSIRITNTGHKDIGSSDVYKQLKIEVPKPYVINEVSIDKKDTNITIKNKLSDDGSYLISDWDLLQKGKSFDITIVAYSLKNEQSISIIDSFYDSMKLTIFAKDIENINKSQDLVAQSKLAYRFVLLLSMFFMGWVLLNNSKYPEVLTPIQYTVETHNMDTLIRNNIYKDATIQYNPKNDSINISNDFISVNYSIDDFMKQIHIVSIDVDNETVSIIHSHWIQHKIMLVFAIIIIALSVLLATTLFMYNYLKNIK